jgi:hypothetical protein
MADISFDYFDHPQNRQVRCRLSISVLSLPLSPRLHSTPHPLVSSSLGHWHWHCSLYGTCLPLLPPHLTSPSPHLSPFFLFEQPTIYNLNLTCNYQYHLYITSTLSPLVPTYTTPQSTSFILSHTSLFKIFCSNNLL